MSRNSNNVSSIWNYSTTISHSTHTTNTYSICLPSTGIHTYIHTQKLG